MKSHRGRRLLWLMAFLACVFMVPTASANATSEHHILRLDAIGRGTGPTPIFDVPVKKPWGIAWRYRCRRAPAEFDMVIWETVNAVELPYTLIAEHGRGGAGMRMETGETSGITMPGGQQAGEVLALHMKTGCFWHVRVVAGSKRVVRRWIPRYVVRSSWTK